MVSNMYDLQAVSLSCAYSTLSQTRSALISYRQELSTMYRSAETATLILALNQLIEQLYELMDRCLHIKDQAALQKRIASMRHL